MNKGTKPQSNSLGWTMSRGAIYDQNRVYVLAYSKRETGTRVFRWTSKWDNYYVPFLAVDVSTNQAPPEIVTVGAGGNVHIAGPGGFRAENVDASEEGPLHRGVLRATANIAGHVFAVGMGRQVYKRDSAGKWQRSDQRILDPKGSEAVCGFEGIHGFSEEEIYAVGMNGEIGWFQRGHGRLIQSPTNVILEAVVCAEDGFVYCVGQVGVILKGRKETWKPIHQELTEETFWDIAWHENALWLATTEALFRLDPYKESVVKVDTSSFEKESFRYLDARDGVLWSFGSEHLGFMRRDNWQNVPLPQHD